MVRLGQAARGVDVVLSPSEEEALVIHERPGPGTDQQDVCPICGDTNHTLYKKERGQFLAKCSRCGFLYLNPMPFGIDPNVKTFHDHWEAPKVSALQAKVRDFWAPTELAAVREWLDVGAGNGELLLAVRNLAPAVDILGIETTDAKIRKATARGLAVRKKGLEEFANASFDVASVMNVLSHVPRPVEFFAAVARVVRPGGCIWICTGNVADIPVEDAPVRLDLPDHLVFVGRRHVVTILRRIGFKIRAFKEYPHFWHNYRPLKPGRFRALYVKACSAAPSSPPV